jgi:hypothetical protein
MVTELPAFKPLWSTDSGTLARSFGLEIHLDHSSRHPNIGDIHLDGV